MLKKLALTTVVASLTLSASAFALTDNGLYSGVQLGRSHTSDLGNYPNTDIDQNSFAGRAYLGYQFNKYISTELGYSYLGTVNFNNLYGIHGADGKLTQQSGDLIAKASLPLGNHFNLFALGGGAYLYGHSTVNSTASSAHITTGDDVSIVRPTYGVGASYDINNKVSLDLSWRQINGGSSYQNVNFAGLGVAYHFG
jgi:OOP family OmpA-OmpF porin